MEQQDCTADRAPSTASIAHWPKQAIIRELCPSPSQTSVLKCVSCSKGRSWCPTCWQPAGEVLHRQDQRCSRTWPAFCSPWVTPSAQVHILCCLMCCDLVPDMLAARWGGAFQAGPEVQQDMASSLLSLGHPFNPGVSCQRHSGACTGTMLSWPDMTWHTQGCSEAAESSLQPVCTCRA